MSEEVTEKLNPEETEEKVRKRLMSKTKKAIDKKVKTLSKLSVEYVPIDSLTPNDWNPNRQNDHDFELLCKSMEEDGFTQPILCHVSGVIVDGEHRWRAARVLGFEEVPVVKIDMPIEQMKIATIRHNRARGTHDIELEAEILRDLEQLGALEWAQDSLLLDDKELSILLDDIQAPDIFSNEEFSTAWEPLQTDKEYQNAISIIKDADGDDVVLSSTKKGIEIQRKREEALKKAKTIEEKEMAKKTTEIYKISLVFSGEEAKIIKEVLGTSPADKILELCMREHSANQDTA